MADPGGRFVAFGGRGRRLGTKGEILPPPVAPPGQLLELPEGSGSGSDGQVHPLLVPGVIDLDGREQEGRDRGGAPAEGVPQEAVGTPAIRDDATFISTVETASRHMQNLTNLQLVVASWIEQLDDSKWYEKLKRDAEKLLFDMDSFEDFVTRTNWNEENMEALLRNIETALPEFTSSVTNIKKYMPRKLIEVQCDKKKESDDDADGVDEKKLFAKPGGRKPPATKTKGDSKDAGKGKGPKDKKGKGKVGGVAPKAKPKGKAPKSKASRAAKRPAAAGAEHDDEVAWPIAGEDSDDEPLATQDSD